MRFCLALLFAAACAPHQHHGGMQHRFENAAEWAKVFEDPARDAWQKPELVIEALALSRTARVADVGSGTGYFAVRAARASPEGRVWAVDIEPDMVRWLNDRARREGLGNLFSILGTPEDPLLPEPVDRVLVVDTYHHIGERPAYFAKLLDRLAPGGKVVIVDFKKGDLPVGPPDAHKLAPQTITEEMRSAGYRLEAEPAELPYQFVLVFSRAQPLPR